MPATARLPEPADAEVLSYWDRWGELLRKVSDFEPDVVVLVARKMPRLFDLLAPHFPHGVTFISDQAIPFASSQLRGARVAILDDVWNVGSTMLRAKRRVEAVGPNRVQLFALAGRQVEDALAYGVRLAVPGKMPDRARREFAAFTASSLRFIPKPFDGDFPIIEQSLCAPFSTWGHCWSWLSTRLGDRAYSLTDAALAARGLGRATVRIAANSDYVIKARLYFDFRTATCNVVPMLLRGKLELANVYADGSLPQRVFAELERAIDGAPQDMARDAMARAQVFCDALAAAPVVQATLQDLFVPPVEPFSFDELRIQFGIEVAANLEAACAEGGFSNSVLPATSPATLLPQDAALLADSRITERAATYLTQQLPLHAFAALFDTLSVLVGADDPNKYALDDQSERIQRDPYLRLRIGISFNGLVEFVQRASKEAGPGARALVSEMLDILIDRGAVVPTFTSNGDCLRIYRKGESDPKVDEMTNRVEYAVRALRTLDNDGGDPNLSRTRVAKLLAIMAYAGTDNLSVQAMERGVVATVPRSVVERQDAELTRSLAARGRRLWE